MAKLREEEHDVTSALNRTPRNSLHLLTGLPLSRRGLELLSLYRGLEAGAPWTWVSQTRHGDSGSDDLRLCPGDEMNYIVKCVRLCLQHLKQLLRVIKSKSLWSSVR